MTGRIFGAALVLCGCALEVHEPTVDAHAGGGGEEPTITQCDGGAGAVAPSSSSGGALPCTPGDVCREAAGWCDAVEVFDDACECPADAVMPHGATPAAPSYEHLVEVCAGATCDGESVDCDAHCNESDPSGCIEGWYCASPFCFPE